MANLWTLDLSPGASTWLVGYPTSNGFYEIPPDTADPSYPEVLSMEALKYAAANGPHAEPCLEPDAPYASGDIVDAIVFGAWVPGLFGSLAGGKWDITNGRHVVRFFIDSDVIAAATFLHVSTIWSGSLFSSPGTTVDTAFYDDSGCVFEFFIRGMSSVLSSTIPWASLEDKWVECETCWAGLSTASCAGHVVVKTSDDGDTWSSLGTVATLAGSTSAAADMDGATPLGYAASIGFAGVPGKHIYYAALDSACDETPSIPANNSAECCASPGVEGSGVVAPGAGVERPVLMSAA